MTQTQVSLLTASIPIRYYWHLSTILALRSLQRHLSPLLDAEAVIICKSSGLNMLTDPVAEDLVRKIAD